MGPTSKREYTHVVYKRYATASKAAKHQILDEFCATTGYNRKYVIHVLNGPPPPRPSRRRQRAKTYDASTDAVLTAIWKAAGYPWSLRLKALLPVWLPWAQRRFQFSPRVERQLGVISPRTIDRHLAPQKRQLKRRLYGRTKPGTLLKHHIPIKTDHWAVTIPGFAEVDLVSHSGNAADGEFAYSLNLTDIHTGWVETCAVMGKGQAGIRHALAAIVAVMPFPLRGLDSDNGSEFINDHLFRYCQLHHVQFTRGRPYKKDDNAHIEQKNWTHVRKLLGWDRYDSPQAVAAINALYRTHLRLTRDSPAGRPAGPPTDPSMPISGTRLFKTIPLQANRHQDARYVVWGVDICSGDDRTPPTSGSGAVIAAEAICTRSSGQTRRIAGGFACYCAVRSRRNVLEVRG